MRAQKKEAGRRIDKHKESTRAERERDRETELLKETDIVKMKVRRERRLLD